jgi:hypothetical protein
MSNKWNKPSAPPSPIFANKAERDFQKQIVTEFMERVVGQQVLYYPISVQHTQYHPLYGEAIAGKTFLNPILINVLVKWGGSETTTEHYGIDRLQSIIIYFHSRRLQEDQNVYVQEGDFIQYNNELYEIVSLNEPDPLFFGQYGYKVELEATCIRSREANFNAE